MTKLTALMFALTTLASSGCYAHSGYYAEPAYAVRGPGYAVPMTGYMRPFGYGYEREHVYGQYRPIAVAPRREYRGAVATRGSARPAPHRAPAAGRGYRR